jgi:extracellular factor (EF) 3-hydroxypalmitic acid methyl ester biosynthesis protein
MWITKLNELLDNAHKHVVSSQGFHAFSKLNAPFRDLYMSALAVGKDAEFMGIARSHPLYQITQEDPFTKRCHDKPRGYAGDAVMLDYVYTRTAPEGTSAIGKHWFDFTTVGSMALSVRYRRSLLHAMIDDAASQNANYQILSVASGHCRELDASLVLNERFAGKFIALDQDAESCNFVATEYANCATGRIEVINQSVRALLKSGMADSQNRFHLIYSAGLYDYLDDQLASSLTSALLKMLRPSGKLVIANFVPESESRGYAAVFMDWHLIYRTPAQLAAAFGIQSAQVTTQLDPHRNVVYASYHRSQ